MTGQVECKMGSQDHAIAHLLGARAGEGKSNPRYQLGKRDFSPKFRSETQSCDQGLRGL